MSLFFTLLWPLIKFFPPVTTVLSVKDDWKEQFWCLRHCLSKLHSLHNFSVRYDI